MGMMLCSSQTQTSRNVPVEERPAKELSVDVVHSQVQLICELIVKVYMSVCRTFILWTKYLNILNKECFA